MNITVQTPKNVILFDADGVLTLPEEVFSVVYARSCGLDIQPFSEFFNNEWQPIVTGKQDLKEHIATHPELWHWDGSPDELLEFWFKTEDVRNEQLVALISKLKQRGVSCYMATDQERYRAEYMRTVMFKNLFDGFFVSADLGVTKTDPQFFELVLRDLNNRHQGLEPDHVIFFDDSQEKVDTAKSTGIDARLFESSDQVRELFDQ